VSGLTHLRNESARRILPLRSVRVPIVSALGLGQDEA
jgi:hypothetical protein